MFEQFSCIFLLVVFSFMPLFADSNELQCGACLALVDEVQHEIGLVDPKKLIQVGSFRIDPQGNQKLNKIPLAKSEVHLYEIFENICEKMQEYGISTTDEGDSVYLRYRSRDGKSSGIVRPLIDRPEKFKYACHSLIEEYEEEIIRAFQSENEDYYENICIDMTSFCTGHNVTQFEDFKLKVNYVDISQNVDSPSPQDDSDRDGDDDHDHDDSEHSKNNDKEAYEEEQIKGEL